MNYPKIIIVEKYNREIKESFWKLKILLEKGGEWKDFNHLKFQSWLIAEEFKKGIAKINLKEFGSVS